MFRSHRLLHSGNLAGKIALTLLLNLGAALALELLRRRPRA